jgi:long-subunit acyl-CoA synthetase (AMP-forming)
MEPLAKELGIDVNTEAEMLIDIAYKKFSTENTLIGSPESCQKMLSNIYSIGITEVACLVDFGIKNDTVLAGLERIVETKKRYEAYSNLQKSLHVENQKTELDLIDEYEITHVQMTPSQSKLILDLHKQSKNKKITSVQHWFIGGEALNKTVVKGLSELTDSKFYNMYGPTETTVWSAWRGINPTDISIGEPIINTNLLLLNEFEQVVPKGVVGELCIDGLGVAKGYYNNIELTNEKFKNINTHNFGNSRFYKTGDLVKQN